MTPVTFRVLTVLNLDSAAMHNEMCNDCNAKIFKLELLFFQAFQLANFRFPEDSYLDDICIKIPNDNLEILG